MNAYTSIALINTSLILMVTYLVYSTGSLWALLGLVFMNKVVREGIE